MSAAAIESNSPELERSVLVAQIQLIYGMLRNANATTLLLSLLAGWFLRHNGAGILWWLAAQVLLKLFEIADVRYFVTNERIAQAPTYYRNRLALSQLPHALGWCSLYFIVPSSAPASDRFIVLATLTGVLSAACSTYGPHLGVLTIYFAPYFGIVAVNALAFDGPVPAYLQYTAAIAPIYMLGLFYNGYRNAEACRRSILLGFSNAELARRLELEAAHARIAHESAVAANEARSRFFSAVSHDLRQPFRAIELFLAALGSEDKSDSSRRIIDHAREALLGGSEMLDMLLDFSRFERGFQPRPRTFPLAELLNRLESEMAGGAEDKGLVYRTRATDQLVRTDPVLLHSVLRNLVSNAVRFTTRGGVLIGTRRRDDRLIIEVWDTGRGIPAADHRRIFEEFCQLSDRADDRRQGLGLGLAIVRQLSGAIDGQVTLNSRPGMGSVFRISLAAAIDPPRGDGNVQPQLDRPNPFG